MAQEYACNKPSGFNNRIKKIAMVGAAGQMGKFIVAELLKKGTFEITAITREGSPNKPVPGVEIKAVNYDDPSTLVAALKGQDALIITMSVLAPPDQHAKLVDAAAAANVPWVLPNEYGTDASDKEVDADIQLGIQNRANRAHIEKLGKSSWVGIQCSFWYEYSLAIPGYGFNITDRTVTWYDDGKKRISTTTWPQVGRAIAAVLGLKVLPEDENDTSLTLSHYRNKSLYVSSFELTQRDMFESLKRVTGTTDADWNISSVDVKEYFKKHKEAVMNGGPRIHYGLMLYSRYFFPEVKGVLLEGKKDNERLGLPVEDLDEWTGVAVKMAEGRYAEKHFAQG
ncbi:NAD(P)-binding protein [Delitschia confertaspora ATCC 74209]|uniref:NAD(P)-binding protein n=1 Tax=Delitschia confertaspora ATCC 74209 TaxID=1513339 RepID=A0A9P4JBH1_9PLEO|nr:NAD(P)-binding protein [Delitschia confertaspora ATCC 74209]